MASTFEGWLELNGKIVTSALEFSCDQYGRDKTKQFPISKDGLPKNTVYGPNRYSGTLVLTGNDEDGFEFDWHAYCTGKSKHTLSHCYSEAYKRDFQEVEFSTASDGIPAERGEYRLTLNWVATDARWR